MTTLLEMLNASEVREDDENFKNAVDLMFEQLQQRDPEHFAVRQYVKYKMAAGKTAKSILISCCARIRRIRRTLLLCFGTPFPRVPHIQWSNDILTV